MYVPGSMIAVFNHLDPYDGVKCFVRMPLVSTGGDVFIYLGYVLRSLTARVLNLDPDSIDVPIT